MLDRFPFGTPYSPQAQKSVMGRDVERIKKSFDPVYASFGDAYVPPEKRQDSEQQDFDEMLKLLTGAIKEYENATAPSDQAMLNYYLKLFSRLGTADRDWEKRSVMADIKRAVSEYKPPISSAPSRGLMGISSGPKGF